MSWAGLTGAKDIPRKRVCLFHSNGRGVHGDAGKFNGFSSVCGPFPSFPFLLNFPLPLAI